MSPCAFTTRAVVAASRAAKSPAAVLRSPPSPSPGATSNIGRRNSFRGAWLTIPGGRGRPHDVPPNSSLLVSAPP